MPVERIVAKEVEKIVYVDKPIEIEKIKEVMTDGVFGWVQAYAHAWLPCAASIGGAVHLCAVIAS